MWKAKPATAASAASRRANRANGSVMIVSFRTAAHPGGTAFTLAPGDGVDLYPQCQRGRVVGCTHSPVAGLGTQNPRSLVGWNGESCGSAYHTHHLHDAVSAARPRRAHTGCAPPQGCGLLRASSIELLRPLAPDRGSAARVVPRRAA